MDLTPLIVAAILFLAAYLQSATGFGLALVCMALLPLVLPVSDAIAYVAIASLSVNIFILYANRAGIRLRRTILLGIAIGLGIPIGYFGLRALDGDLIIRLLGIVLMAIAVWEFLQSRIQRWSIPDWAGAPLSFFGGILAGAFNVGGPPIVVYVYSRNWSKVEMVAILQAVFVFGSVTRNGLMIGNGEYTADLLWLVLLSIPGALLGVWLGKLTLDRLPQALLKRIVFALIFLIGLRYAITG